MKGSRGRKGRQINIEYLIIQFRKYNEHSPADWKKYIPEAKLKFSAKTIIF